MSEAYFGTDRHAFCMRFIGMDLYRLQRSINAQLYAGPWQYDPDAFPLPVQLDPTLRRFKCVRVKDDGYRRYRVRVYSVPKGTKHVRVALAMLAHCLDRVAPWDERETRRRAAIEKWNTRDGRSGAGGLAAWLPKSEPLPGQTFSVPIRFGT